MTNRPRRVLISAANNQSFENVKMAYSYLNESCECYWLDMSSIFHQNLNKPSFSFNKIQLECSTERSFYRLNELEKLIFLHKVKTVFSEKHSFDLILFGDLGIIEYNLLRRNFKGKVVFIQDSILLWSEKFSLKKKLRSIFYKNTRLDYCDKVICSGLTTKKTLMLDGVMQDKIEPIGIPRFQEYCNGIGLKEIRKTEIPIFLFVGEAYSWHGHKKLDKEQKIIVHLLDKIQSSYSGQFRLVMRRHPRDNNQYNLNHIEIIDPQKVSLRENLQSAKAIINYGFPSTVLFEAATMNKKTMFIMSKGIKYDNMTNYHNFLNLAEVIQLEELENLLLSYVERELEINMELLQSFIVYDKDMSIKIREILTGLLPEKIG